MTTLNGFKGAAKPLDAIDIPMLADRASLTEDHMRAFLKVESRSRGFDSEGRPITLFEPHVFYRGIRDPKKRDEAVKAGLAYENWGEKPYPMHSYPRLEQAVLIDEDAALKACSIGRSQVLVENFSMLGYKSPQEMWQAFMDDEEEHVEAMMRYMVITGIDADLRAGNFSAAARKYNGPGYKKNRYHIKLADAFREFQAIPDFDLNLPDDPRVLSIPDADTIKSVQRRLKELGYPEVGRADGGWGTKTRAAVLGFRADHDLPLVADIDDALLAALMLAEKRPVSEARANTTVSDIRAAGSRQIAAADRSEAAGWITTVGSGVVAAEKTLAPEPAPTVVDQVTDLNEKVGAINTLVETAQPLVDQLQTFGPYILFGIGAFVIWQSWKSKNARVDDTRKAIHAG